MGRADDMNLEEEELYSVGTSEDLPDSDCFLEPDKPISRPYDIYLLLREALGTEVAEEFKTYQLTGQMPRSNALIAETLRRRSDLVSEDTVSAMEGRRVR